MRWTVAVLAVVAALITGFAAWLGEQDRGADRAGPPAPGVRRDADTDEALADLRQRADLPACPAPTGAAGSPRLGGLTVDCAADGSPVEVAAALAGRTVVLNLWAYWCGPCADELPAMASYQRQAGDAVTVVTVHQDPNEAAALLRMAELGVRLPVLQDGRRSIAAALGVPNVMPATVVLRPDGTVAEVLPRPFATADEITAAVAAALD